MDEWTSKSDRIIDCHVHMVSTDHEQAMLDIREAAGIDKIALVSIQNAETGTGLTQSLYMKVQHPDVFYVFAGLNHAAKLSGDKVAAPSLAEQVERFAEMGCDGIKMIEGKPTWRQVMNVPVTDGYYADYWARVEELGLPIVWHVNDPEEFWEPEKLPAWARERNWGYGPDDVEKETLYSEVDEVLGKHPGLQIIFAHFYFLSADLPRAARFFDEHPNVHLDLTPGVEMLYNISRDVDAGREFFTRYADRIVYGTDISSGLSITESRIRAGIVFRWLETSDTFRMPEDADFLLGPPDDGLVHGMSLPDGVLSKIYHGNFVRLAGASPTPLDVQVAIEECGRLATVAEAMSGEPAAATEPARVAERLRQAGP